MFVNSRKHLKGPSHSGRLQPYLQTLDHAGKASQGQTFYLILKICKIIFVKSFTTLGTLVNFIRLLCSSFIIWQNKLQRLQVSLIRFDLTSMDQLTTAPYVGYLFLAFMHALDQPEKNLAEDKTLQLTLPQRQ